MTLDIFDGVGAIADAHDGFILDLWGVIHDGHAPYPGAIECLESLRNRNKRIVFLTNAPRRAERVIEQLRRFGVADDLYDAVVSSGQAARDSLAARMAQEEGRRRPYFHLGPERDAGLLEGLPFDEVDDIEAADLIVNTGFDDADPRIEPMMPLLEAGAARGVPMICTNPDIVVVRQDGSRFPCAGLIARHYEELGGHVTYFGKPHGAVYDVCLSRLAVPRARVAAIGDGPATDIAGAVGAGIDAYLVTGGIMGETLGVKHGQRPDSERLAALCAREGIRAKAALPAFVW